MKFPFFKALLISGAMLAAWNCSDNAVPSLPNGIAIEETVKELNTGNETLYIADDNTVKNDKGEVVGSYDPTTGTVTDTSGNTVVENVSKDELDDTTISYPDPNAPVDGNTSDNGYGSGSGSNNGTVNGGSNTGSNSGSTGGSNTGSTGGNTSSGTTGGNTTGGNTGSAVGGNTGSGTQQGGSTGGSTTGSNTSSGTTSQNCSSDKCFDKRSSQCVDHYKELVGPNGEKYAYKNDCSIDCWWDESKNNCSAVTSGSNTGSNNNQPTSSASQQQNPPKSSASTGGSVGSGSCSYSIVNGGATGSGWATRYWDGCKPSCSWKDNAFKKGGIGLAKQCSANGKTTLAYDTDSKESVSTCDGGSAATCTSQVPFTVDGCANLGFAFAAAPAADGAACGKCFELTFTGQGNWETKANHEALRGKKLIIMVSNVGWDVQAGQFDIMIPGGGLGRYDGTSGYNWGDLGAREGGLLSDCENSVGWDGDLLTKRKQCLVNKCNSTFANDNEAKQGCLFLANYMQAAGNPKHTYKEITCPSVLSNKY